jgi:hypothetical protein
MGPQAANRVVGHARDCVRIADRGSSSGEFSDVPKYDLFDDTR